MKAFMIGFSMIQLARRKEKQLDKKLRHELVQFYRPFRRIPCIFHRPLEYLRKKTKKLPVVIEFESGNFAHGLQDVKKAKCKSIKEYPSISCCSGNLPINKIQHILENCNHIKRIHFDRKIKTLLDVATPSIHSGQLRESGYTGKDVTIGVIDTGVHPHEDLNGRIVGFKDFINDKGEPYDDNGHGTHCSGDAAGDGQASNGKYKGPATEANIVGVKVLDKKGSGSLSTVIAGIDWCIQNQSKYNINILSLSIGSPAQESAADDPVVTAVEKAWDSGMVVCVAAGNSGPSAGTIGSPGISPKVITVGAVNDNNTVDRSDDVVADFSSRGPTIDGITKPNLLTPGVNIISLRSPKSYLNRMNAGARVDQAYLSLSGTSMATPICAGVVAQLLQKEPNLTPDQVKQRLIEACEPIGQSPNIEGHGYLNAANLLTNE